MTYLKYVACCTKYSLLISTSVNECRRLHATWMQHSEQKIGLPVLVSEKRNPCPLRPNIFDLARPLMCAPVIESRPNCPQFATVRPCLATGVTNSDSEKPRGNGEKPVPNHSIACGAMDSVSHRMHKADVIEVRCDSVWLSRFATESRS